MEAQSICKAISFDAFETHGRFTTHLLEQWKIVEESSEEAMKMPPRAMVQLVSFSLFLLMYTFLQVECLATGGFLARYETLDWMARFTIYWHAKRKVLFPVTLCTSECVCLFVVGIVLMCIANSKLCLQCIRGEHSYYMQVNNNATTFCLVYRSRSSTKRCHEIDSQATEFSAWIEYQRQVTIKWWKSSAPKWKQGPRWTRIKCLGKINLQSAHFSWTTHVLAVDVRAQWDECFDCLSVALLSSFVECSLPLRYDASQFTQWILFSMERETWRWKLKRIGNIISSSPAQTPKKNYSQSVKSRCLMM